MMRRGGGGRRYVCFARAIKMFQKAPTSFQTKYPQYPKEAEGQGSLLDNEWLPL